MKLSLIKSYAITFFHSPVFIDFGPVIGGSVGGILGLILVIAVIAIMITYCKYRKTSQKKNEAKNVAVNYTQGKYGAAEEVSDILVIIV